MPLPTSHLILILVRKYSLLGKVFMQIFSWGCAMCCENPQCCQSHLLVQYSCCCGTLWKTSWTGHMLQSPPDFPWQVLLFLQARDGAPPRPAPQKWPEQTEGAHAAQPIPHKGASSQDQCWTKPLPFSAMPSFSDQAFQAHLALAQVIKG